MASHSWSAVKLDLYGPKFYYEHVLRQPWVAPGLIKPPRVQRLPDIVTVEEARRIIAAATVAEEFACGLHTLGIVRQTTLPYSPQQNGKQEVFWGRLEGRLMAMLEGVSELTLELLNTATQAWVEHEYQRTKHCEIELAPSTRSFTRLHFEESVPERPVAIVLPVGSQLFC